ncbi:MAG: hypothetical protein JXX14_20760 [Deltaproteobacteria bacterium]|nr:hypothetical protein [Deltaproteobacteria bacterium]
MRQTIFVKRISFLVLPSTVTLFVSAMLLAGCSGADGGDNGDNEDVTDTDTSAMDAVPSSASATDSQVAEDSVSGTGEQTSPMDTSTTPYRDTQTAGVPADSSDVIADTEHRTDDSDTPADDTFVIGDTAEGDSESGDDIDDDADSGNANDSAGNGADSDTEQKIPDSATADTGMDTDSATDVPIGLDTASLPFRYVQTGDVRVFDAKNVFSDLMINAMSDGNIVVSGATSSPASLGLEMELDTDAGMFRLPFMQVLSPAGDLLHQWVYPDGAVPEAAWVTSDGIAVWVGQMPESIQFGDRSAVAPESGYFFARLNPQTGAAELVTTVATDDSFHVVGMTGDDDGNIYVAGAHRPGEESAAIIKHHPMGTPMWEIRYASCDSTAYFTDVEIDHTGALVGVGAFNCDISIGEKHYVVAYPGDNYWYYDGFVGWMNADTGVTTASLHINALNFNYLQSVDVTTDGVYRLGGNLDGSLTFGGQTATGHAYGSAMMMEVNQNGDANWVYVLDGDTILFSSGVDALNRSHLVGRRELPPYTDSNDVEGSESFILALDETGAPLAIKTFETNWNGGRKVAFDGTGGVWMSGQFKDSMVTPNGETINTDFDYGGFYLVRFELVENNAGQ